MSKVLQNNIVVRSFRLCFLRWYESKILYWLNYVVITTCYLQKTSWLSLFSDYIRRSMKFHWLNHYSFMKKTRLKGWIFFWRLWEGQLINDLFSWLGSNFTLNYSFSLGTWNPEVLNRTHCNPKIYLYVEICFFCL